MYKAKLELLPEKNKLKIYTNSREYIMGMKKQFSRKVQGYFWMPAYRAGNWNGEMCMITGTNSIPYGLLFDYVKIHKKHFQDNVELKVDYEVKMLFRKNAIIDVKYDLKLYPRPYQKESIEICLKYTKGIIRSATASGKSLVISYIIKNILDSGKAKSAIIIVPSTSLVEQFKNDMVDYGMNGDLIGKVYADIKEWDKPIVISTWQTLMKNHKRLADYEIIIGDECHQTKAHELKKIFSKSNADFRFGFTGTLPSNELDLWNVKAFIGPVLKEYPSGLLAEQGFISKCNVKIYNMNYGLIEANSYHEMKREVFAKRFRSDTIINIVKDVDHNILLLVGLINEGKRLKEILEKQTDRDVVFLSGKDKVDVREDWRQKMMKKKDIVLIATYGIMSTGINIPNLKYLMLASPFKAKIRILQSIGRALRKHENKEEGAYIYDIADQVKYLGKHSDVRKVFYEDEGFDIEEIDLSEI